MQIFNTCPNLIRELQSIPLSKTNPEDVDTHASDHAYDALRYMIMSRPRMENPLERMRGFKREMPERSEKDERNKYKNKRAEVLDSRIVYLKLTLGART